MLVLLIVEVIVLIAIDQKIWGTYFTPITFLSVPFVIVLVGAMLFAEPLGFVAVHFKAIIVWIVGLFVFWLPGFFIGAAKVKLVGLKEYSFEKLGSQINNLKLLTNISWILIAIVFFRIYSLSRIFDIGSSDFSIALGQGVPAHCAFALRFIVIFFIATVHKKKKSIWVLIFLILFSSLIYGAKSWLLIPIIGGLFTRIIVSKKKIKISVFKIVIVFLGVFAVFFSTYYVSVLPAVGSDMNRYLDFVLNHIARYFFAGIMSFSEYLRLEGEVGIDPNYIYGSPINIINVLTRQELRQTTSDLWNIITNNGFPSNVKTMFGSIYIYAGVSRGILSVFFFGSLYYTLLAIILFKRNVILVAIYAFIISILIFGWFEMYFQLLAFYELPVMGFIIYVFTKKRLKLYSTDE